eukprot:m.12007 g.12007  ORF g.12007 m.12007 type:complete len:795 (+) comp9349_c0_seq1:144-2528(+)
MDFEFAQISIGAGTYTGTVQGCPNGSGTGIWSHRDHHHVEHGTTLEYKGDWYLGQRHGQGRQSSSGGCRYTGSFAHDQKHGNGDLLYTITGASHCGTFHKGKANGPGRSTSATGVVYEGDFLEGYWHGAGEVHYPDGAVFVGRFKQGLRHGHGDHTYADKERFIGEFCRDQRCGRGEYTWPDGRTFTGEFADNERHGEGVFSWPNGDRFEGTYQHDVRCGYGRMVYAKGGAVDAGVWRGSKLVEMQAHTEFATQEAGETPSQAGPQRVAGLKFLQAAVRGNVSELQASLGAGDVYVDIADEHGYTALYYAVMNGNIEAAKLMLRMGAHVNHLRRDGSSMLAAAYRTTVRATNLFRRSVDAQKAINSNAERDLREAVFLLLDNDANTNLCQSPEPILLTAVRACDIGVVQRLLTRNADVNVQHCATNMGTPLLLASQELARCSRFVDIGRQWYHASQGSHQGPRRLPPLAEQDWGVVAPGGDFVRSTCIQGDDTGTLCGILLDHDATPDIADADGCTPLHVLARVRGTFFDAAVVQRIVKSAAVFDTVCHGRTALSEALHVGNDGFAALLMTQGADVNDVQPDGSFALLDIARTSGLFGSAVRSKKATLALLDVLFARFPADNGCDPFLSIPAEARIGDAYRHADMPMNVIDYLISMSSPTEAPTIALVEALMAMTVYKKIVAYMRKCNVRRVAEKHDPAPMCEECGRRYGVELHAWRAWLYCSEQCKMRSLNRKGSGTKSIAWNPTTDQQVIHTNPRRILARATTQAHSTDEVERQRQTTSKVITSSEPLPKQR